MKAIFILLMGLAPLGAVGQAMDSLAVVKEVDSLIQINRSLVGEAKFDEALQVIEAAENKVQVALGKNHPSYASCLNSHGRTFTYAGDYQKAEPLYLEALAIREKVLGKEHADYAQSLHGLGLLYYSKGDYAKAELLYLEAKDLRAKVLGKEHLDYASTLINLALLYNSKEDYAKAEPLYLEAKEIQTKILGKEHPDYASTLMNLGVLYYYKGDYGKAEPLYLEAKEILTKTLGKEHPNYAYLLHNLGILYDSKGEYTKSEPLYLEAKEILIKTVGKEHPNYVDILDGLATLYGIKGDLAKEEPLALEVKDLRARNLGKEHPDYAISLNNLGLLYYRKGDYAKAESLYLEAKEIQAKSLGTEHPSYALVLGNLGNLYLMKGDYAKAEPLYLEAKEIQAKSLGTEHPSYAVNLYTFCNLYSAKGDLAKVEAFLLEAKKANQNLIEKSATYSSESQMLAYLRTFEKQNHEFQSFSLSHPSPELARANFDNTLFFNGLLLENARRLARSIASADSLTRDAYERWQGCRRRLSGEYAKPIEERQYVAEVEAEAEGYEKTLTRNLSAFEETRKVPHWQDVQAALKPGEAAVEFIHYRYYTPKATDSTMYAALVLRPGDAQPQFIPLFEEKELAPLLRGAAGGNNFQKINALYAANAAGSKPSSAPSVVKTSADEKAPADKQKSLYDLIWQPLESLLAGTKTVYCSPSGLLHRINLAAIPATDGKTFGDNHQLVLLGSTRSLAVKTKARQLVAPNASATTSTNSAYLVGGIRYTTDSTAIAYANRSTSSGSRSIEQPDPLPFQPDPLSATRGGVLDYLPATATEVREIGQTLAAAGIRAKIDTGFYATEEAFRQLGVGAPSPRIVHLATHGYFFPDPVSKAQKTTGNFGQEPVFKMSDHPMIRSGLIMAGAKQAWLTGKHPEGQEDGILTAYEISQMNLSGTELVVLSACETGLGDIMGNEGVYGLQRAFKIAGAKYLVMSLWKVDDRSTQEFMTAFYRHWLTDKQLVPQAFRAAQREVRVKHSGAYDWAGFVLIE